MQNGSTLLQQPIAAALLQCSKHAPNEVKILPMDLTVGEESLKKVVEEAESLFPNSGVDYMIHNTAF
ncbi:dehydrogenase/reductase SDR family member 7 [Senna tora]|uniref:Dehydrogenase/reductase SDR family member 7 n=1 Tax=Senna tora TaxID=362788 RepID=A0A834SH43_9FABA|nr:dehydrogenase/reductase SDR family member 7 [Senna tora]